MAVDKILYSRTTGVETWITTDGRAYFVTLHEQTTVTGTGGIDADDGSTQVSLSRYFVI